MGTLVRFGVGHLQDYPIGDVRIDQGVIEIRERNSGWIKTTAGLRQTKHRGRERVSWMFTFTTAAYNLIRVRNAWKPRF